MPIVTDETKPDQFNPGLITGTRIYESETAVIYRCSRKVHTTDGLPCKLAEKVNLIARTTVSFYASHDHAARMVRQARQTLRVDYLEDGEVIGRDHLPMRRCECQGPIGVDRDGNPNFNFPSMRGKVIVGTLVETVVCNDKCQTAVGHICNCSCGGANHGDGFRKVKTVEVAR